jgi:pimeloyl-ACP methyl ester carboxylesterase
MLRAVCQSLLARASSMTRPPLPLVLIAALAAAALLAACRPGGGARADGLEPCRLPGIEREILCGSVAVPEDPDQPAGRRIEVRFAVVPAVARNKQPDPVFVLAGGPGQAATRVIGLTLPFLAELNARRDLVYVDQRGTGGSSPLDCPDDDASLAATLDPAQQLDQLRRCLRELKSDTRQFGTWIAVGDLEAVRMKLGADRINLWGGSYGTRVALEFLRQFPQQVRSIVLDGVAPPDMALPAAFSLDADAALSALTAACRDDSRCRARYPDFAERIAALLARAEAGFDIEVADPLSGRRQTLRVDRTLVASLLRVPLYVPTLAAGLPYALAAAGGGQYDALVALTAAVAGRVGENFALGMHFAVICAEDLPRITPELSARAAQSRFGTAFVDLYTQACASVATRPVPAAFYTVPRSDVPVLVLSGGLDPATPPRHGAAVAAALGNARHIVAPALGHGVSGQACAPRLITRFVRERDHINLDAGCLEQLPTATFFEPIESVRRETTR